MYWKELKLKLWLPSPQIWIQNLGVHFSHLDPKLSVIQAQMGNNQKGINKQMLILLMNT